MIANNQAEEYFDFMLFSYSRKGQEFFRDQKNQKYRTITFKLMTSL